MPHKASTAELSSKTEEIEDMDTTENWCELVLRANHKLEQHIYTTLWISDLHGEGNRFVDILRGRFGVLFQTCREALPSAFTEGKIDYICRIVEQKEYFYNPAFPMVEQDVILCLCDILKYKAKSSPQKLDKLHFRFRSTIMDLIYGNIRAHHLVFEEPIITRLFLRELCKLVLRILLDRMVVLGDIFDRGPEPDRIVRILKRISRERVLALVLGNHDVLWMGACGGSLSLIAEVMRITCRYSHLALLDRLKIDYSRLQDFAVRTYPAENITGNFKAKQADSKSMEKALAIIQFKLEEACIRRRPDYAMDSRLYLNSLAQQLSRQDYSGLTDTHFPTIDPNDPLRLSPEEQEIIDDLCQQFMHNTALKSIMRIFFEEGKSYYIHDTLLNVHALIPSDESGEFSSFCGYKGKALLDYVQAVINRVGKAYLAGKTADQQDTDFIFYLWCGPRSPLFGKDAMKTFERYFLSDKATHKENTLHWENNLKSPAFQEKIKAEFGVERVVFGHTPRNIEKGQRMASADGFAINIDGGFAEAYLDRGHALIETPTRLYGIILPTPEEQRSAERCHAVKTPGVEVILEYPAPKKLKNIASGRRWRKTKAEILANLSSLA